MASRRLLPQKLPPHFQIPLALAHSHLAVDHRCWTARSPLWAMKDPGWLVRGWMTAARGLRRSSHRCSCTTNSARGRHREYRAEEWSADIFESSNRVCELVTFGLSESCHDEHAVGIGRQDRCVRDCEQRGRIHDDIVEIRPHFAEHFLALPTTRATRSDSAEQLPR